MNLNELSKNIRFDNASKGFDPLEGGINRYVLLTVSEICEAQDQLRDGHGVQEIYYTDSNGHQKPEGFPIEIADAIIRLLDIAGKLHIDIEGSTAKADVLPDEENMDDWLLNIVNIISQLGMFDMLSKDFHWTLCHALFTLFFLCEKKGIGWLAVVEHKLAFNRTRPPKHGRKF